jgi:hypothetical protein
MICYYIIFKNNCKKLRKWHLTKQHLIGHQIVRIKRMSFNQLVFRNRMKINFSKNIILIQNHPVQVQKHHSNHKHSNHYHKTIYQIKLIKKWLMILLMILIDNYFHFYFFLLFYILFLKLITKKHSFIKFK